MHFLNRKVLKENKNVSRIPRVVKVGEDKNPILKVIRAPNTFEFKRLDSGKGT